MNYHLIVDDKFLDDFISNANKISKTNVFILESKTGELKHIKSDVQIVNDLQVYWQTTIEPIISINDKVFIHWFHDKLINIINTLPKEIILSVFFWGGEFTETPQYHFRKSNYLLKTLLFYENNLINLPRNIFYPLKKMKSKWYLSNESKIKFNLREQALKRVNYIFHWNELDIAWIRENYNSFKADWKFFFYEFGMTEISNSKSPKNNYTCWVGNSATYSNNHLDTFYKLKDYKFLNIICPLSYGEHEEGQLVTEICKTGYDLFGNRFIPIHDFMKRDEYYKLFIEVDFVIMNHLRTQAAGNIFMFLYNQIPVFMNAQSTLYKMLKNMGIQNLFNFDDFKNYDINKIVTDRFNNDDIKILNDFLDIEKKNSILFDFLK